MLSPNLMRLNALLCLVIALMSMNCANSIAQVRSPNADVRPAVITDQLENVPADTTTKDDEKNSANEDYEEEDAEFATKHI